MTTYAKDIIQAAAARHTANAPGKLFSKPELIAVLSRRLQSIYATVSESYPIFFAKSELVEATSDGWPHPTDMTFVFHAETVAGTLHITVADIPAVLVLFGFPANQLYDKDDPPTAMDSVFKLCDYLEGGPGTEEYLRANMFADYGITGAQLDAVLTPAEIGGREVAIVPLLDLHAEEGVPRIYQLGRFFHSVGESGDPVEEAESVGGESLRFYGPLRHPDLVPSADWGGAPNVLDATWPEQRNDLLVAELAHYLAVKDARGDADVTVLDTERKELLALLQQEAKIGHTFKRARRFTDQPVE